MAKGCDVVANPMEAALVRKLKIRLLPFLFVLFVLAFIDRINLGFAALTMNQELGITSQHGLPTGSGLPMSRSWSPSCLSTTPSTLPLHLREAARPKS